MDIASLLGLVLAIAAIFLGVGGSFGDIIDIPSFMITVVGSLGATFISNPKDKAFKLFGLIMGGIKETPINFVETLQTLYSFADKARREGLISLENDLPNLENEFMRDGLRAAIDGTDPNEIRKILETKMEMMEEDMSSERAVLIAWGAYAPAFGMIGTLIGLVLMLKTLNDPTTIGPKMAIALLTTLYGALIANILTLPISEKLAKRGSKLLLLYRMIMEGVLSIVAGENPRLMEEKLKAFMPEDQRKAYEAEKGTGE